MIFSNIKSFIPQEFTENLSQDIPSSPRIAAFFIESKKKLNTLSDCQTCYKQLINIKKSIEENEQALAANESLLEKIGFTASSILQNITDSLYLGEIPSLRSSHDVIKKCLEELLTKAKELNVTTPENFDAEFILDVWCNSFSNIYESFYKLDAKRKILEFLSNQSTTKLDLSTFQLSSLPEIFHDPRFQRLKTLNLSKNNLTSLPKSFENLTSLENLNLSQNRFKTLPEFLGNLVNLTSLDLSYCDFSTFPAVIGKFTKLKYLNGSNNRLSTLPEELINCIDLEIIILVDCKFKTLPECIGKLPKLKELNASFNPLDKLPESLFSCKELERLRISFCDLKEIPESIGNLTNLIELNAFFNPLREFPETLLKCTKLKHILPSPCDLKLIKDQKNLINSLNETIKETIAKFPLESGSYYQKINKEITDSVVKTLETTLTK